MPQNPVDILVVDDTPQNLVTIEAVLDDPGIRLVPVRSAREALRYLLGHEVAAILLDVNMPDMDGFEAASLIRGRPSSAHTPILFLTAYPGEAPLTRAYSLGAVDYMLTPVQPEVLRAKVSVFADLYRKSAEVTRQAELLREAEHRLRQRAEDALRESEGRFRVLCTCAPVAIFQTDGEGRCQYVSPMWETTTEQPSELAAGFGWAEGIAPGAGDAVMDSWRAAAASAHPWVFEQQRRSATGAPRWLQARVSPIVSATGVTGHVGTVEDVTPHKLQEERLREADRRKDEFLAMLAHELRNPLAAISSAAVIARTPGMESRRAWSTEVIARQVQHLSKLVDDLLDVSRITLGKIQLQRAVFDFSGVLTRAFDAVHATFDARHQRLDAELTHRPLWVEGDETRLEQVLVNLLGNASKYSDDGSTIELRAGRHHDDIVVRVRDHGIGIEPAALGRIFELFAQADAGLDRTKGGLGIGLSLARRITELHGGHLTALSEGLGRGSEFVLTLPAARAAVDAPDTRPAGQRSGAGSACPSVLVVDDNADAVEALKLLLESAGHRVFTAYDGEQALACAQAAQPDVVLLDIGLPRLNGFEVARRLRVMTPRILLVAVSGYGQEQDRRQSREAGFDHHLVKPVDLDALLALLVRRMTADHHRPAALDEHAP
jgi:PAS domain S-box-containing protein